MHDKQRRVRRLIPRASNAAVKFTVLCNIFGNAIVVYV